MDRVDFYCKNNQNAKIKRSQTMHTKKIFLLLVLAAACVAFAAAPSVTIQEWNLPASRSLPHDPAVGPDGALWFTAMNANAIGRLDQRTGEIREYPLKTPESGPHGLTADRKGIIWFTANYKGYIGRLEPRTGFVTEYPLPDRTARDPHTPVFDGKGILWFTVQSGNFVGNLDPDTGKITLKLLTTANAHPYGIAVNTRGIPFFCEFGANKIGSIDPATMVITEFPLPEGARPRRLAITNDDIIYYTDFRRGYLGELDPASGKVREWLSPGGEKSAPYGVAITPDGVVWYAETGIKPNMIVSFDRHTHKFERWSVPSGGGVIRNIAATSQGNIYIACSGANTVGVVWVTR